MNFERLVLGCIDTDFCKQIFVGKLSTRISDLSGLHPVAPLRSQNFTKTLSKRLAFSTLEILSIYAIFCIFFRAKLFSIFVAIVADFHEIFSDFLSKILKNGTNFHDSVSFHHDYTGDVFHFRLNFRFDFQFNFYPAARTWRSRRP